MTTTTAITITATTNMAVYAYGVNIRIWWNLDFTVFLKGCKIWKIELLVVCGN
jgi:hypothetical protein